MVYFYNVRAIVYPNSRWTRLREKERCATPKVVTLSVVTTRLRTLMELVPSLEEGDGTKDG